MEDVHLRIGALVTTALTFVCGAIVLALDVTGWAE
jgi:hypothetical protein